MLLIFLWFWAHLEILKAEQRYDLIFLLRQRRKSDSQIVAKKNNIHARKKKLSNKFRSQASMYNIPKNFERTPRHLFTNII